MSKSRILFEKRKRRTRNSIGHKRPRLSVFKSNKHIYAQIIDDVMSKTLVAASTMDKALNGKFASNIAAAKEVGRLIAEKARERNIADVVFDRGGYLYHGCIAALAEASREFGLRF